MNPLIPVLLVLVIITGIMLILFTYQMNAMQQSMTLAMEQGSAQQQVQLGEAAWRYVVANPTTPAGTVLDIATLQANDDLPAGYPAKNPFGQIPEALVGKAPVAGQTPPVLVVYTAAPKASTITGLGLGDLSAGNPGLAALAARIAVRADGYQQEYKNGMGVVLSSTKNTLQAITPFGQQTITLSTIFPQIAGGGYSLPQSLPMAGDLLGYAAAYEDQ